MTPIEIAQRLRAEFPDRRGLCFSIHCWASSWAGNYARFELCDVPREGETTLVKGTGLNDCISQLRVRLADPAAATQDVTAHTELDGVL